MQYTVKQLSRLAGVSIRTLHYYDEIHLLKPTRIAPNGYRYYGEEAFLQLQQILFYREMDFSLDQIGKIIQDAGFNKLAALKSHKMALEGKIDRLRKLVTTVDNTISHLNGEKKMTEQQLFQAFSDEEHEMYALEAEKLYDPQTVRDSNRKWKGYTKEKKDQILAEGNQIYLDVLKAMPLGAGSNEAQACIERWRRHMDYFWTPQPEQLIGLAETYNNHPGFKKNFDKIDPRLAKFMLEAVTIFVSRLPK